MSGAARWAPSRRHHRRAIPAYHTPDVPGCVACSARNKTPASTVVGTDVRYVLWGGFMLIGGDDRIRTGDQDFADPCLATWPRRLDIKRMLRRASPNAHSREMAPSDFAYSTRCQAPCASPSPIAHAPAASEVAWGKSARYRYCITPGRSRRLTASSGRITVNTRPCAV